MFGAWDVVAGSVSVGVVAAIGAPVGIAFVVGFIVAQSSNRGYDTAALLLSR